MNVSDFFLILTAILCGLWILSMLNASPNSPDGIWFKMLDWLGFFFPLSFVIWCALLIFNK